MTGMRVETKGWRVLATFPTAALYANATMHYSAKGPSLTGGGPWCVYPTVGHDVTLFQTWRQVEACVRWINKHTYAEKWEVERVV